MPDNQRPSAGTALKLRPDKKTLLAAALLILGAVVLISAALALRKRPAEPQAEPVPEAAAVPAEPQAAPASEALPPVEAPEREEAPALPEAAGRIPADTSSALFIHNAQRRDGFPLLSWDVTAFRKDARGRMVYEGDARTLTGIDVSEHQYDIDWSRVAAAGVDFAMIRVGYRGSTAGGLYLDEYFERNMAGAARAGVPVGVYFYSQAISAQEAREEAEFVLEHLRGYDVTYPVVFDWEIVGGTDARTYSVSRRTLVECARAFCDRVTEAGYRPMLYFTRYLGYRKYILRNLTDYGFWYAEYEDRPRFAFDFDMWQYSDTGRVDGVDGEVDLNILFVR